MKRRILTGFVPVLVVAAVLPAATQAAPHYYSNNVLIGAEPKRVTAWGTITLALTRPPALVGTTITCHNAIAGTLDNPTGGSAGAGNTDLFATYKCESQKQCLAEWETKVKAERLPSTLPPGVAGTGWPSVLTEEVAGTIRAETTNMEVDIECVKAGKIEQTTKWHTELSAKGLRPRVVNGTSALHAGFLEYDEGSGEVEVGDAATVTAKPEGAIKTAGYEEQELINVKNP
jgi:hypothetical protein